MVLTTFRRREKKFLITEAQFRFLLERLEEYTNPDPYCTSDRGYDIFNLYFDTDCDEIIRRSVEKPVYKEKLRIRSYGVPKSPETKIFFELKKKLQGVVFKRRAVMTWNEVEAFLKDRTRPENCSYLNGIVLDEIEMFLSRHPGAYPKIFVGYERLAFFAKDDPEVRVTFDRNIRTRRDHVNLTDGLLGEPLLDEGTVLMEIKISESIPRWMMKLFSEAKIYRTSFSKYGREYERKVFNESGSSF